MCRMQPFHWLHPVQAIPLSTKKSEVFSVLGTILIIVLVLALLGALPRWPHSRSWGYYPTGGIGFLLAVVVILLLLHMI
jgi:hypothetical protein